MKPGKAETSQPSKPPLWTCPRCGHRFVTQNLWHSCSRFPLSYHFKGKDPIVREIFDEYLALLESFGPITVIPQKTRIAFQVRVRFSAASTRKHWLDCTLWLKRRATHPLFHKIETLARHDHIHSFRLKSAGDVRDEDHVKLLRESYQVGCQEHEKRKP